MHKGPARRENPAASALFLRGGLMILRLAILFAGLSPMIPRTYGASQGSGDTRCDTRGAPHCVALYSVNTAPDFFHHTLPPVSPMLGEVMKSSSVDADASERASASMKRRRWTAMAPDRIALLTFITLFLWLNRSYMACVACAIWWVHVTAKRSAARGGRYLPTAARLILGLALGCVLANCVAVMLGPRLRLQR